MSAISTAVIESVTASANREVTNIPRSVLLVEGVFLPGNYHSRQSGNSMRNPPPPLSPTEKTALAHLTEQFEAGDPLDHEMAVDHCVSAGVVRGAAHDLIEQLCLKGYLYITEDGIHLTDP
jgi:hypothetical protein